jgi:hypothetical protein
LLDDRLDRVDATADEARRVLRMRRGSVTVVANLGSAPVEVLAGARLLLASDRAIVQNGSAVWSLPPDSVVITGEG